MTVEELKEHFESLLASDRRAVETASVEREKAAAALRDQLAQAIAAGDTALREHVTAQVGQLRQLVSSAEQVASVRFEAAQEAIAKAEVATEKRFELANEWRGQSADRERTMGAERQRDRAELTASTRTDAIEEKLTSATERNREDIVLMAKRLDLAQGQVQGVRMSAGAMAALIATTVGLMSIVSVLANVLT